MQKGAIAGVVAAGLLIVGAVTFNKYQAAKSMALAEAEKTFATLKAAGVGVSHGEMSVDAASGGMTVTSIALKSADGKTDSVKIAKVITTGVSQDGGNIAAKTMTLEGVDVSGAMSTSGPAMSHTVHVTIPKLTLENVRLPAITGKEDGLAFASQIQAAAATAAEATVTQSISAAAGAPPVNVTGTYRDVAIKKIEDGRIGDVSVASMTFTSADPNAPLDGKMGPLSITDIDWLVAWGGKVPESRKAENGFYKIQGPGSLGAMEMKMPDGVLMTIGQIKMDGMSLDPQKSSMSKLFEALAGMEPDPAKQDPAEAAKVFHSLATWYEGMGMGLMTMEGLKVITPATAAGGNLEIEKMSFGPLEKGRVKEMRLDKLLVDAKGAAAGSPMKLGTFAIKGMDISTTMRKAAESMAAATEGSAPKQDAMMFFRMFDGVEVAELEYADPVSGTVTKIEKADAAWSQFVHGMPANMRYSFKGAIPLPADNPNAAVLAAVGVDKVDVEIDTATTFDEKTQTYSVAPFNVVINKMAGVSGTMKLAKVSPDVFDIANGGAAKAAPLIEVTGLDLTVKDLGAVAPISALMAMQAPPPAMPVEETPVTEGATGDPAAPAPAAPAEAAPPAAPDMFGMLKAQATADGAPAQNMTTVLDGVSKFISKPGQQVTVSLSPKENAPVTVMSLMQPQNFATIPGLAALLEQFAAKVTVEAAK